MLRDASLKCILKHCDTVAICGRKSINFVNVFVMCEKRESLF